MPLPSPFLVLATQNPIDFQGTYPLPEAQLDRFVLRFALGYPDEDEELGMLADRRESDPLSAVRPVASGDDLRALMAAARRIHVETRVVRYLRSVVGRTRDHDDVSLGVSPRGTLVLYRACQARALLHRRDHVLPDDIQALAVPVLAHRMQITEHARYGGQATTSVVADIVASIPVPA
jgi:MoxR-like ATPase